MKVTHPTAVAVCSVVLVATAAFCFARDQAYSSKSEATITLRLINGKNGKPIKDESPNVWVGTKLLEPVRVDSSGEIKISIDPTGSTISFFGNYYRDCRYREGSGNVIQVKDLKYPASEIVAKGIVTENFCGEYVATPTPGVLVIYLRPMTFSEKMAL